jgi:hypothetical protein
MTPKPKEKFHYKVWRTGQVIIEGTTFAADAHSCEMNIRVANRLIDKDKVEVYQSPNEPTAYV